MSFLCRLMLISTCVVAFCASFLLGLHVPGLALFVIAALVMRSVRRRQLGGGWAYGTATEATQLDLLNAGMLSDEGLIVGRSGYSPAPTRKQALKCLFSSRFRSDAAVRMFLDAMLGTRRDGGDLIRLRNVVHGGVFAPSGKGKGVSILLPNLLAFPGNCVITDPKGELFTLTAEHRRRKFGHKIVRLDPFNVCGPGSDTFNPLDFLDPDSDDFRDQCHDLANMLVHRTGFEHETHWVDSAELVLTAFLAYIAACEPDPSLRNVHVLRKLVSSTHRYEKSLEIMQQVESHRGLIEHLSGMLSWYQERERDGDGPAANRRARFAVRLRKHVQNLLRARRFSFQTYDHLSGASPR